MKEETKLQIKFWSYYGVGLSFCLVVLALGLMVANSECTDAEEKWQAYSVEHSCNIIDRKPGRLSATTILTTNGVQMIPYNESGISTYKCDNGTVSRREM